MMTDAMRAWLPLLLVLGCAEAPCPVAVPSTLARPFVWRVTGPTATLTVQATHQAAGPDDVSMVAWAALEQADVFIAEAAEPQTDDVYDWDAAVYIPKGQRSLRSLLGAQDFDSLRFYLDANEDQLAGVKPWVALMLLGRNAYSYPDPSIGMALLQRAKDRSMALEFVETWDEQVRYLEKAITPGKLEAAIRDYPKLSCHFKQRIAAFRAGDDAMFSNEIAGPHEPAVWRSHLWFVRLEDLVTRYQRPFVALGIGHLVGPYGLLAQFAAKGYTVERL